MHKYCINCRKLIWCQNLEKRRGILFVEWLLLGINGTYVIYEDVKFFVITLLFFRHYIKNICILRNRLINFITVNLKHG